MTKLHDASLGERLAALAEGFRQKRSAEEQAIVEEALAELRQSGLLAGALAQGETAPDFELTDLAGRRVSSTELLTRGPMVIAFYRGAWCPYCNLMLRALYQVLPAIEAAGASLVAISPELPSFGEEMAKALGPSLTLLLDPGGRVAHLFGLLYEMPPALAAYYRAKGIDVAARNGLSRPLLPLAAAYVVAPDGTVVYAFLDCDPARRVEPPAILAALASLKIS